MEQSLSVGSCSSGLIGGIAGAWILHSIKYHGLKGREGRELEVVMYLPVVQQLRENIKGISLGPAHCCSRGRCWDKELFVCENTKFCYLIPKRSSSSDD